MPSRKYARLTVPIVQSLWLSAGFAAYSALTLLKPYPPFSYVPEIPLALDAVTSFALALLIAFRVNRAYERWWEGRTLWGKLVNVSRNLAIKIRELPRVPSEDKARMRDLIVAFCRGLKDHLRDDPELRRLPGFERDFEQPGHLPSYIVRHIYEKFAKWDDEQHVRAEQLWILDSEARWLMEICGACERIKNTLMPISWRWITWKAIVLYLLILPWGLVDNFGWWTIPLTMLATYFSVTAEVVARHVEEPFGADEDQLDLKGLCEVIDRSVSEVLREPGSGRATRD
ncbi:MAG TPA: hypothetical protein ENJ16_01275 [Planctomycetaceae bacterium]|nr:hypothetical protein [Planctomycetaceae bacterium]